MSRGARLAVIAGLTCAGAVAIIAVGATTEPEPEPAPAPSRVYSSCMAADTVPVPAGGDPCAGR
ncbi:hypothetical protein [Streptomyces sp. NPDC058726]|uniref:hypothetical protein n=1 Tax=Streptomyces sp. NPDC058726 TaxID=3346611 RepID=UPI00368A885B